MMMSENSVDNDEILSEHSRNQDNYLSNEHPFWQIYLSNSQKTFNSSSTINDDCLIKQVVKCLIDSIDLYERKQLNSDKEFKAKNDCEISSSLIEKSKFGQNLQSAQQNATIKRKSISNQLYHKKRSKQNEEEDPTFVPKNSSSIKTSKCQNVRRSKRFIQRNETKSFVDLENDDFSPSKLKSQKNRKRRVASKIVPNSINASSASTNFISKINNDMKEKHLHSSLEFGISISSLKQRMSAKESLLEELKTQFDSIEQLKEKLTLERVQIQFDTKNMIRTREVLQKEKDDISSLNMQLQNENTRLRKINVHLQNSVVVLEKKLNEKLEIFNKIGLDTEDSFQRLNPYLNTTKLDAKKSRQRLLFNCADVIAGGSIEDGVQLVSDLHKDLQEDISNKYIGRGHPVLAESQKRNEKASEGKNKKPTNVKNLNQPSTSHLSPTSQQMNMTSKKTNFERTKTSQQKSNHVMMHDQIIPR